MDAAAVGSVLLEALANLFVTLEQYDQAKVHALQLAELAPDNILCWIRLGLIAYKQNDIETFEQSLPPRRVCSGKLFPEVIDTCFDGFDLLDGALQLGPAAKLIGASQGELYVGE